MEKDLKIIKQLAAKKEDKIDAFCEKLKKKRLPKKKTDAQLKKLFRQIAPHFDCTACAACCKEAYVVLETDDIARLSKALGMKRSEFRAKYVGKNEDGDTVFNRQPCPFLNKNLCTQYDARPDSCRAYPFSLTDDSLANLDNLNANYTVCPVVYHAMEKFRKSLNKK